MPLNHLQQVIKEELGLEIREIMLCLSVGNCIKPEEYTRVSASIFVALEYLVNQEKIVIIPNSKKEV